jgi:predicted phosphodiesterase
MLTSHSITSVIGLGQVVGAPGSDHLSGLQVAGSYYAGRGERCDPHRGPPGVQAGADTMNEILVIGDVHGKVSEYRAILKAAEFRGIGQSIQLGDMGFSDSYRGLASVDPERHGFIPGNHDNYDNLPPHALKGDFGETDEFFWVRGAFSVDRRYRTEGVSWWPQEEISMAAADRLLSRWELSKPEVVLSHDCPESVVPRVITNDWKIEPSRANQILQSALEIHRPRLWIFGHHHQTKTVELGGTTFKCLGELQTLRLEYTR